MVVHWSSTDFKTIDLSLILANKILKVEDELPEVIQTQASDQTV